MKKGQLAIGAASDKDLASQAPGLKQADSWLMFALAPQPATATPSIDMVLGMPHVWSKPAPRSG